MRKMFMFTCISIAVACIYLGWVYYSRWRDNQALIARLEAPGIARDRAIMEAYGGGDVKILSFYAVPSMIRRGETAQICYSVANAEEVHIQPPPQEDTWPSRSRCVVVAPQKNTNYKIYAKDNQGNEKTADLTISVRSK